jgi:16S rRNA (guanine527-N7)-methyltransferase
MSDEKYLDKDGRYWRIEKWFPTLPTEAFARLRAFHSELLFFNGRMNLISPKTEKAADQIHIADAIIGSQIIYGHGGLTEIYDIGSGNGVPGLIFSVLYPQVNVVLVDADARKIEFLKHCISRLQLSNCRAALCRFENVPAGTVNNAMSRGFASVSRVLITAHRLAGPECNYFHFKGPSWTSEVASIPPQALAHWEPSLVADYKLPESNSELSIVLTRRTSRG